MRIEGRWDGGIWNKERSKEQTLSMIIEIKRKIAVPRVVHSHEEFANALLRFYEALREPDKPVIDHARLFRRGYYVLGWMVGDATKQHAVRNSKVRTGTSLCKRHPENLALGEYFSESVSMLGVPSKRIADEPPRLSEPHGSYRWLSTYSLMTSWLKSACLGLARDELTSYVPVKMDWLLTAPREFRLWFLRGLADSDGTVNGRNKFVSIITSPNTTLVQKLFDSLGCKHTFVTAKGVGVVTISGPDALRLQIFNPEVLTHRRKLLEKVCGAATFQRRWPHWLEERVDDLFGQGLDPRSIHHKLLDEDHVYVKIKTLKAKQNSFRK